MLIKNLTKLVSGTFIAQLLPFVVLPFLVRDMSSNSFGIYSLFFTTSVMLGSISSLRFEYAINSINKIKERYSVLYLSIVVNSVFSLCMLLILIILSIIFEWSETIEILILPLSIFLLSLYQALYAFSNSEALFGKMSKSRIFNQLSCAIFQLVTVSVFGLEIGAYLGLIFGYFIACIYLMYNVKYCFHSISTSKLKRVFHEYIEYPKVIFPGTVINLLSSNLPMYIIGFVFGPVYSGYFSLANRIAGAPTSIIGRSIGDIFRENSAREISSSGSYIRTYKKMISISTFMSVLGFLLLYFIIEDVILVFLGDNYSDVTMYIKLCIPMYMLQFISSTVSYSTMLSGWQRQELLWQIFRFFMVILSLAFPYYLECTPEYFVLSSSISLTISFAVYLVICNNAANSKKSE